MKVMGIDPGIATTGYAVIERSGSRLVPVKVGVIRTSRDDPQASRLVDLHEGLSALMDDTDPEALAIERLFFNANVRTAMAVGQAAGVALLAAGQRDIPASEYTPPEVKQSVTGTGSATKKQVQAMAASLLGIRVAIEPADAADACALAICHLTRAGLTRALEEVRTR